VSGWRPALRIARRELLRAKGAPRWCCSWCCCPVAAVVCLSTLLRTDDISPVESLPRELGAAQARLEHVGRARRAGPARPGRRLRDSVPAPTPAQLRQALPEGSRLLEVRSAHGGGPGVGDRRRRVGLVAVDLADPS
jgi:putative ABC transport system permease protein